MPDLFVKNVPFAAQKDDMAAPFLEYGTVTRARLIIGDAGAGDRRRRGRPMGYGFVEMPSPKEAKKAIEALSGKLVFLSGLPAETTIEEMEAAFHEYMPMVKEMANLGNPEPVHEERGGTWTPTPSENEIGYLVFTDEKVAASFVQQHEWPTGRPPVLHGSEVSARLSEVERAKPRYEGRPTQGQPAPAAKTPPPQAAPAQPGGSTEQA